MKPITTEYIRRFSTLILLVLFAWMFFYTPSDIYTIQYQNFKEMYEIKKERGIVDLDTSLEKYIERKMQGPYWHSSPKEVNILELKGDDVLFLEKVVSKSMMGQGNNNYYFREKKLPESFRSNSVIREADYLHWTDVRGEKHYVSFYIPMIGFMLREAPTSIKYPLEYYSYFMILLALLIYFKMPKIKVPEGAAYYTRLNTAYLPDILGFSLWTFAWIFFFLPDDSMPVFVRYFLLSFFGIFALAIVLPTIKYASNWYLFTEKMFRWSDADGVGSLSTNDIVSIKPYKRQLPKWVAVLIVLFGRGNVGATGMGSLAASSTPEIGMEITTKSGKKIKVMANYLEADEVFTERFQELEEKLEAK